MALTKVRLKTERLKTRFVFPMKALARHSTKSRAGANLWADRPILFPLPESFHHLYVFFMLSLKLTVIIILKAKKEGKGSSSLNALQNVKEGRNGYTVSFWF